MRLAEATTRRRRVIGLTPLIDVVFILLVFFMLVTSFDTREARPVRISATSAENSVATAGTLVRIDISGTGELRIDGKDVTSTELMESLHESPTVAVLIVPEASTAVQTIIAVMDVAEAAGINTISLADSARSGAD